MKKKNILIVCLVVLFIIFYSWYSISKIGEVVESKTIPIQANISDKIGLLINDSILDFGNVLPGTSVEKKLSLSNTNNFDLEVLFLVKGNISSFILASKNQIKAYETKEVPIVIFIPVDTNKSFYSGELQVVFKKV